ncbi:MAG: ROK family protein [Patescibacteria group bacterium]
MSKYHLIGVDVGGTHLKVGIREPGTDTLVRFKRTASLCGAPAEEVWSNVFNEIASVNGVLPHNAVIGLSMPGELDSLRGVITSRRLGLTNFSYVELFAQRGLRPVGINDAQASAIGELHFGAGRHYQDMVILTLGTNIGGAIIYNGRLMTSSSGYTVGVVAHVTVDPHGPVCRCGRRGCWETKCSKATILTRARQLGIDCQEVEELAQLIETDERAQTVFRELGENIAQGILVFLDMLAPQAIVLSGGISKVGSVLTDRINEIVQPHVREGRQLQIMSSPLGDMAGVLGATYLAEHHSA